MLPYMYMLLRLLVFTAAAWINVEWIQVKVGHGNAFNVYLFFFASLRLHHGEVSETPHAVYIAMIIDSTLASEVSETQHAGILVAIILDLGWLNTPNFHAT